MRFLLDVNCWLALVADVHSEHVRMHRWVRAHPNGPLILIRETKIGLLRLLTAPVVMGEDARTAAEAWQVVDRLQLAPRVEWAGEPETAESFFRRHTLALRKPNSAWMDSWLLSVAESLNAKVLTLDQGLRRRAPSLTASI